MEANTGKQRQSLLDYDTREHDVDTLQPDPDQQQLSDTSQADPVVEQPKPEIPEKYKGKSLDELVKMHEEAEKVIGRQGSELGELRRKTDEIIFAQLGQLNAAGNVQPKQQPKEDEELDFFRNPEKVISRMIEEHPAVKTARTQSERLAAAQAQQALYQKHADTNEVISDPKFIEWVRGSRIRSEMFARAHNNYDLDAADELLSTWKTLNKKQEASVDTALANEKREREFKAAGVTSGGGDAPTVGGSKGKFLRRADIIDLMRKDPERYEALAGEIRKAYAEGRVR